MLGNAVRTQVVVALLLAMLMGWAGHASVLPPNAGQAVSDAAYTADHLHETPHLNARLDLASLSGQGLPAAVVQPHLPTAPVFLIERPPRS